MAFSPGKLFDIPYFTSKQFTEDYVESMGGQKYLDKISKDMKTFMKRYRPTNETS